MNKVFRHKILAGAMLFGFMLAGTSCRDKEEGIKVTPETPFADKTLYEVVMDDPDLTDFVEVINACGAHCADSLFNQSRVYTVWAPVNGTFNKDSIIAETVADSTRNSNRDLVFRSFVEAHIANHLVAFIPCLYCCCSFRRYHLYCIFSYFVYSWRIWAIYYCFLYRL